MKVRALALLFCICCSLFTHAAFAQTTTIVITDDKGNQTTGTLRNGNLYLYDSHGNQVSGTLRSGYVYLNGSQGEYTFGTIRNGNVFLTDQQGNTTGTIKNGQIFLNNSDGSTTTGTYDHYGNIYTTTTPSVEEQQRQLQLQRQQQELNEERQRQIDQQNYDAGYAVGSAIGGAIAGGIASHRITTYCKYNPMGFYRTADGITIQCPNAPLTSSENDQANAYCADNPGSWMEFGRHRVDCLTPPNPANLKWAIWELKEWGWDYHHQAKAKMTISSDQIRTDWTYWQGVYCSLTPGSNFKDLDGKKQHCN